MVVEPTARKSQEPLPGVRAGQLFAQHSHQSATVMISEPTKPKRLACNLLVLDQRRRAAVHRAQRCQVRGDAAESQAQMPPQQRRDDPNRLEQSPAPPQEANLQCQSELELGTSAGLPAPALGRRSTGEDL